MESDPAAPSAPPQHDDEDNDDDRDEPSGATSRLRIAAEDGDGCCHLLRRSLRDPDQLTAMISNYSTSYNVVNVAIVLPVLRYSMRSPRGAGDAPAASPAALAAEVASAARRLQGDVDGDEEGEDEEDSLVASSLLAGMIVGQLIGGLLGDVLGRRTALACVMALQLVASVGGSLFITTDADAGGWTALTQLAAWRFFLGIGAGGVYPLAAVMSAENKAENGAEEDDALARQNRGSSRERGIRDIDGEGHGPRADNEPAGVSLGRSSDDEDAEAQRRAFQRIALTFSTQGVGFITVPLLAYPLLLWRVDADVIWRVLLGVGGVPAVLVLWLRRRRASCRGGEGGGAGREGDADRGGPGRAANGHHGRSHGEKSAELPTLRAARDEAGGGGAAEAPRTLQDAVSTLFQDTASRANEDANELALVDNSHLDAGNDMDETQAGSSDRSLDVCADELAGIHQSHLEADSDEEKKRGKRSPSLWESIRAEPGLGKKFAGTAGTWFLFDVTFYGNTLFEPIVLEAAFGSHSDAKDGYEVMQLMVRDTLVISLLSIPAYFVTVCLIGRKTCACQSRSSSSPTRCSVAPCFPCHQTPVFIQMQGFAFMAVLYTVIGVFWASLAEIQWLLLVLYAGTFFFANYGPNTTTFLLPSVTYSEKCRSTLNGISAAAGKLGAVVGASVFAPAVDIWGEQTVMLCCASASLFALILTKLCLGEGREHN